MNKELEEWINDNNPYELVKGNGVQCDVINAIHHSWTEGAKDMAEYLSSSEKENNLNTPPTKEYLEKALDLLFWCCKTYTPTTEEQEEYINDILTRWNDENKEKND